MFLHLGGAEVRRAQGREVAQGLALLLQRHYTVFLKHFEREKERIVFVVVVLLSMSLLLFSTAHFFHDVFKSRLFFSSFTAG